MVEIDISGLSDAQIEFLIKAIKGLLIEGYSPGLSRALVSASVALHSELWRRRAAVARMEADLRDQPIDENATWH